MAIPKMLDSTCSISRSLGVLGERWTFLVLREALGGTTRFAKFREVLGLTPDVLTDRLTTLVEYGVMVREPYQEPGSRPRDAYLLTDAGRELAVVLAALQQWGDKHVPWPEGPSVLRQRRDTGRSVHVGFIDEDGKEVPAGDVEMVRTAVYPA